MDIAKHDTEHFSENDKAVAADMVRKGYVISDGNNLCVNVPVFTQEQYQQIENTFFETIEKIANEAEVLMEVVTKILKNHMPVHLKKMARGMAYLRLFEDAISEPVSILYDWKCLQAYTGNSFLPTTYVILK